MKLNSNRTALAIGFLVVTSCIATQRHNIDLVEAISWYTGAAGYVDDDRARGLLEQAAASQDTLALMWLARVHSTGRMGFPQDRNLAQRVASRVIEDVERLASEDDAEASFLMGTAFAEGLGKTVDLAAAALWYERAARLGNMLAQHNMGNIYASGTGVPQNDSLAVFWWLQAAEQGDAIPQFRLGVMFEQGLGIDADILQAIYWYKESALRGYSPAQAALHRLEK